MTRFIAALPLYLWFTIAALAQSSSVAPPVADTTVHIGWGDLIGQLGVDFLPWAGLALFGIVMGLLGKAFPVVGAILTTQRTAQVEQLLERALGFAAAQLQNTLKGRELTVDAKNQVIAQAVQYAIDHGSAALIDFMGGQTALPDKVAARMLTSPAMQAVQAPVASATVATSAISQQPGGSP